MDNKGTRISNAFQLGLLGGLGVLTAVALGNALLTLANIVTYVALALFIALGLEPIVSFIETELKFKRSFAILTVVGTLLIVLGTLIWSILPMVIEQTGHFIESAPARRHHQTGIVMLHKVILVEKADTSKYDQVIMHQ